MIKPDFFIIGAQKAGTTTLHKILQSTNLVSLPKDKETHYFSIDDRYNLKYNWYVSQFDSSKKIFGEVDPSYLYINKSAERIKKINNNPKFVIILRKPIDRSYSHYLMSKNRGYEKLSFVKAVDLEKSRLNSANLHEKINFSYLDRSNYCKQILFYKKIFPNSEFLYLNFDHLSKRKKSKKMFKKMFNFLNINYDNEIINYHENMSYKPYSIFFNSLLNNNKMFKNFGKILIPSSYRYKVKTYLHKLNNSYEKEINLNNNQLSNSIITWNNNEVIELEKITKLSLKSWII